MQITIASIVLLNILSSMHHGSEKNIPCAVKEKNKMSVPFAAQRNYDAGDNGMPKYETPRTKGGSWNDIFPPRTDRAIIGR